MVIAMCPTAIQWTNNVLSHLNTVHTMTHYLFEIRFNIIAQLTRGPPRYSLPSKFTDEVSVCVFGIISN